MKNLPAIVLLSLVLSCNEKEAKELNIKGAYSMTSQVLNDGTKDSAIDRKQLKIFTDRHMMYASANLTDSFANFGIGEYSIDKGKVVEHIFYSSTNADKRDTVTLLVDTTENGFTQVIESIPYEGKNYKLTEKYIEESKDRATPLDGAWKQVKNIYITSKGDSSVNENPMEYKVYQSGNFIWAITTKDSTQTPFSVFGYGVFQMDGDNKSVETIKNSTFTSGLVGKTYEVAIELDGNDSYKQTITFANGDRSVEIYKRLK